MSKLVVKKRQNPVKVSTNAPKTPSMSASAQNILEVSAFLTLSEENCVRGSWLSYFQNLFASCRRVKSGACNIPLSVCVSIIDFCNTHLKLDMLYKIDQIFLTYKHLFLAGSDRVLETFNEIKEILISGEAISVRIGKLDEIYNKKSKELEMIVRNLGKIVTKMGYNKPASARYREFRPAESENLWQSELLNLYDLVMVFDYLEVQLRVFDVVNLKIIPYGAQSAQKINMLQRENCEISPLYTHEEAFMQRALHYEAVEMQSLLIELEPINDSKAVVEAAEANRKQVDTLMNILKDFITMTRSANDYISVDLMLNCKEAQETLWKYCCNGCNCFKRCAKFPCDHLLCLECGYKAYNDFYVNCSVCGFTAGRQEIDKCFV